MRNQKGVTLISLITTVIIILMLAGITATSSISSFKSMKYQTFRSELEEIQDAVNEICEKYALLKQSDSTIDSYNGYFEKIYGENKGPTLIGSALTDNSSVADIVGLYGDLDKDSTATFYFTQDDIKKFLGLEVTLDKGIIVDFSTRKVYSIDGCEDPTTKTKYYTLSEVKGETNVSKDTTDASKSSTKGLTASDTNSKKLQSSGTTKLLKVTLTFKRDTAGINYPMKHAYYSTDGGTKYLEVDYLGNCTYSEDGESVSFIIYNAGTYYFYAEDTFGVKTTPINVTYTE